MRLCDVLTRYLSAATSIGVSDVFRGGGALRLNSESVAPATVTFYRHYLIISHC